MAQDNFKNQIIESDVDSDIVYEKEKPDRYKEILEGLDRNKLPSSKPVINLTSQSYVDEHSIGTPGHDSVIEYIDRESDLSQHLAGSTEENLNKLKTFWNLSVGALAEYILDNFRASYQEDETNIAPKKNGEQKGTITKMDILAADAQWSDELSDAVRPLVNIDGETYDRVRNEDYDLKVDSNGNEINYPYGLENKSRDLFNLPIENSSNLTYTRYKEQYKKDNYGIRLIMPKNVRRVEIEDLNRNFWVIAQTIATLSSYIFDDGPINTALKGFSSEIIQLWENTIYLWIRIYYEHNKEAQDNIILTLPLPAEGILTSNKYNNYYAIDEHWIENEKKDVDGHSQMGVTLPDDDSIKEEVISRLSYLIDKHPKSNICVIPYIKLNNYKKNYYSAVYYPGIYFYRKNKNKVYFRFFKVGENNRLIIRHEDYSTSLSAISSDNNKYIYPASLVELYLEKEADIYYSGIRTQIKQNMEIIIEQEDQKIGYYLKDFELYLYDMVDKGRKFGDPLIKTLGKNNINLIADDDILLEEKEGEIKKTKSSTILDNYRDIPYYLGEIVSNKKKTTKDGNYRVTEEKDQIDTPEKVLGGFTAPLFLFNQDFSDYVTIKKDNDDIKFEVKIDDAAEEKNASYHWINFSPQDPTLYPPLSAYDITYSTLYVPEYTFPSVYYSTEIPPPDYSESIHKIGRSEEKASSRSRHTINNGMKNLSFSEFKEKAGLNQENGKYWTSTLDNAKNAALNYLIDNISAQETITSSSGQRLDFTKKETKNSEAYNFFAKCFCYQVYSSNKWIKKEMTELISNWTSFDSDWSRSSVYGEYGPPKDVDEIQKNYLDKVNSYKENNLETDFDLQFFYNIFFKPNSEKENYNILTFIENNSEYRDFPSYLGNDAKTYGMYGVLAIIGRYVVEDCFVTFPLPYYWRYIFDNKINDLSIYDKTKTLNDINNREDNTQKAIVSQDYKTSFNSKKIHPFITYSKGGLNKVKSKEGEKTVYTITLKQELISKITFFIEADYLTGEQAQSLDQVCNDSKKLLGYAIRWEGLDIDMRNIPFNEIEFGTPEIYQIGGSTNYPENTWYEAIRFSSNEPWWDDFFKNLTADDVYPDSLNNYINNNQNGVDHYYITKKKNDTAGKVEKELNQGKKQSVSESQMKENLLRILKRDPQISSKIIFPFTYDKKKYQLILTTETINGETETTGDIVNVI